MAGELVQLALRALRRRARPVVLEPVPGAQLCQVLPSTWQTVFRSKDVPSQCTLEPGLGESARAYDSARQLVHGTAVSMHNMMAAKRQPTSSEIVKQQCHGVALSASQVQRMSETGKHLELLLEGRHAGTERLLNCWQVLPVVSARVGQY